MRSDKNTWRNSRQEWYQTKLKHFSIQLQKTKDQRLQLLKKKKKLRNTAKEEVRIEKDVLGSLLAESNKTGTVIDNDKPLKYPLSPV